MFLLGSLFAFALEPFDEKKIETIRNTPFRQQRLLAKNPTIPTTAYTKASMGEIVTGIEKIEGKEAQIGWGIAVVDIPLSHFFASINEEEQHVEYTAVSFTKIVHGTPCSDGREVLMVLPLPIIADRWWVTHQYTNPKLREASGGMVAELVWKEIPNWNVPKQYQEIVHGLVQIPFTQGSWFLYALDHQHTLAEYHSWVDPGGSIPAGPASQFAQGSIKDTFHQMISFAKQQKTSACADEFAP